jgi:formylglycine-generating enzyme required for sulfatase activity
MKDREADSLSVPDDAVQGAGGSEQERADPIPLDVLASEMRRQSEWLATEKAPDALDAESWAADEPTNALSKSTSQTSEAAAEPAASSWQAERRMGKYQGIERRRDRFQSGSPARKTSDVLTDRLIELRRRAELAERQHQEALVENRQLRGRVTALEQQNSGNSAGDREREVLRRELELVRSQAVADMKVLKRQLEAAAGNADNARNVEIEAELQALRQETAALRNAAKQKDSALEDLAAQCRGLEDQLEDRDREMERLHRDLGNPKKEFPASGRVAGQNPMGDIDLDSLFSMPPPDSGKVLQNSELIVMPDAPQTKWKLVMAGGIGLLVGLVLFGAVLFLFRQQTLFAPSDVAEPASGKPSVAAKERASGQPQATLPLPASAASGSAVAPSETKADQPAKGFTVSRQALRSGGQGPAMVALPGGDFLMGNKRGMSAKEEQPAHKVRIQPFSMAQREVTFDEYDQFARASGRALPEDAGWGRGSRPVVNVSWDDAQAYVRWLSQQTGSTYRLPSEAEWEYAARAGTSSRYWWGFAVESGHAVCFDCGSSWDNRRTAPTGSLPANAFQLQDTAGNAMEWVEDCYNANYQGAPEDGSPWRDGDCSQRMVRGGAFNKPSSSLRSAARYRLPSDARFNMLGFRVARD